MTPSSRADWTMVDDLVARAGTSTPDYLDEVLAATARVRQRPAWTFPSRWLPAVGPIRPVVRFALVAALLALALVGGLMLTGGWPPPAPPDDDVSPTPAPTAVSSPTPAASPSASPLARYDACTGAATTPLTLTAWDQETGDVGAVIDELIGEFEEANPGVTVDRTSRSADELAAALEAGLADAAGPDVVQVAASREAMGTAARAGLLLPLTDAAARYGWEDRWAPAILARTRFADDGRGWGAGTLFGVAMTGEIVGGFFNLDLAAQRPVRPYPTNLAEEMEDWAAMQDAGHQPFVLGAADGDALHLFGSLLQAHAGPGWLEDLLFARDGATFATPEAVAAAEMLVQMRDAGFLGEGYAELGHDEAIRRFLDGGGELLWTGSWDAPALAGGGVEIMFVTLPSAPSESARALGGPGVPWAIRATTAEPGCAAALLDYLTGDHAAQLLAVRGLLPSHVAYGAPSVGYSTYQDLAAAFRLVARADRLDPRLESLFPGARATFQAGLARLLAGETTPDAFVAEIEAAYRAYLGTLD